MTKKNFLAIIALALGMVLCMFSVGCGGTGDSGNSSSGGTEDSSSTGGGTVEHTHTLVKVDAKAALAVLPVIKNITNAAAAGCFSPMRKVIMKPLLRIFYLLKPASTITD